MALSQPRRKLKNKVMNIDEYYDSFKGKMKDFLERLDQEKDETKEAFKILSDSIQNGTELTDEEKEKIGEQLKDVLKTIGLVGATILPGGFIYFLVAKVFKLNKYVLPSSFHKEKVEKKLDNTEKS
jgi:hypothetical protein